MDGMRNLRLGATPPTTKPIPAWLNLYDRNDLIAFAQGPLRAFSRDPEQGEVRSHLAFPFSHLAYVDQDDFWNFLIANWPSAD